MAWKAPPLPCRRLQFCVEIYMMLCARVDAHATYSYFKNVVSVYYYLLFQCFLTSQIKSTMEIKSFELNSGWKPADRNSIVSISYFSISKIGKRLCIANVALASRVSNELSGQGQLIALGNITCKRGKIIGLSRIFTITLAICT
jgi:hypothetical protein